VGKPRFRKTDKDSLFGNFIYERVVPPDHFFRRLGQLIDWEGISGRLTHYYRGEASYGAIPYEPAMLFKMLLVAYIYNLSERQVEELANDSLVVKCFLGLAVDERAPDHSSLAVFRERLLVGGGTRVYEELFQGILRQARAKGIKFGKVQVVDSTHTVADVDVGEDNHRGGGKGPRDPEARWGAKGSEAQVVEGKRVRKPRFFYGYKEHMSLNAETELVTAVEHTVGNVSDGRYLGKLVEKDEMVGVEAQVYAGDKGYDHGENHLLLWEKGKKSALCLKGYRTQKKDANKGVWRELEADADYQKGLGERYKIERKFAEAKCRHGLRRCRYVGLAKYAVQGYLTAIVLNLKRMVKLLFGVSFRNQVYGIARAG